MEIKNNEIISINPDKDIKLFGVLNIPSGTTNIAPGVLESCADKVKIINLPDSFENAVACDFKSLHNLEAIRVSKDNPNFTSKDGILFSKDGTELLHYPSAKHDKSYTIPEGVQTIRDSAFSHARNLAELHCSEGVANIGEFACAYCKNLKSVFIPSTLQNVGENAFCGNDTMTEVHVSNLTDWCHINFENERSNPLNSGADIIVNGEPIVDLKIPDGIAEVKPYSFYGSNIKSLTMNNDVKTIGESAFEDAVKLRTIEPSENLSNVCGTAFHNTLYATPPRDEADLKQWEDGTLYVGKCLIDARDLHYENLTHSIGDWGDRPEITVNIRPDTRYIDKDLLSRNKNIVSFNVHPDNPFFTSKDGVLYNKDMTTLYRYPAAAPKQDFVIPDTVDTLGESALKHASFSTITIPNSLTNLSLKTLECDEVEAFNLQDGRKITLPDESMPKHNKSRSYDKFESVKQLIDDLVQTVTEELKEKTQQIAIETPSINSFDDR